MDKLKEPPTWRELAKRWEKLAGEWRDISDTSDKELKYWRKHASILTWMIPVVFVIGLILGAIT